MANWLDIVSFVLTVSVFAGAVYVVLLVVRSVSQGVESAKEGLKTKGVHITDKGVAVKTSKRFDREDYVDATQRGIVNVVNASSFRKGPGDSGTPPLKSSPSSSSSLLGSPDEKKKRSLFKRAVSGSSSKEN
ncbi:hypothetical protein DFH06DRAFT_1469489 [Mycena polygramma]|nr:hypothetical protein DFH06DRAFT_1469489 [Mycena polygramma]